MKFRNLEHRSNCFNNQNTSVQCREWWSQWSRCEGMIKTKGICLSQNPFWIHTNEKPISYSSVHEKLSRVRKVSTCSHRDPEKKLLMCVLKMTKYFHSQSTNQTFRQYPCAKPTTIRHKVLLRTSFYCGIDHLDKRELPKHATIELTSPVTSPFQTITSRVIATEHLLHNLIDQRYFRADSWRWLRGEEQKNYFSVLNYLIYGCVFFRLGSFKNV